MAAKQQATVGAALVATIALCGWLAQQLYARIDMRIAENKESISACLKASEKAMKRHEREEH